MQSSKDLAGLMNLSSNTLEFNLSKLPPDPSNEPSLWAELVPSSVCIPVQCEASDAAQVSSKLHKSEKKRNELIYGWPVPWLVHP